MKHTANNVCHAVCDPSTTEPRRMFFEFRFSQQPERIRKRIGTVWKLRFSAFKRYQYLSLICSGCWENRNSQKILLGTVIEGSLYFGAGCKALKQLVNNDTTSTRLKSGYLEVPAQGEKAIHASLTDWYTSHALAKLEEKTGRYAKTLNVEPSSVTVKEYKSRWGSCSTSGDITYNWRIIMAPHRIVDYVVIHELCHLVELNHSDKYWKQVESLVPDYRERRAWLKTNANTLAI